MVSREARLYPVDSRSRPGRAPGYFSKLNSSAAEAPDELEELFEVWTTVGAPEDPSSLAAATCGVVAGASAPARAIPETSSSTWAAASCFALLAPAEASPPASTLVAFLAAASLTVPARGEGEGAFVVPSATLVAVGASRRVWVTCFTGAVDCLLGRGFAGALC